MDETKNGIVLKKKHLIIGGVIVLALLVAAVLGSLYWSGWFAIGKDKPGGLDLDPNAAVWAGNTLTGKADANNGISIPGYPSITLPANTKNVQVVLLNPEGNPCYFQFAIMLKEGAETIYTSKLVPPGKAVTNLTLEHGLPPGKYEAEIQISTTSLQDHSPMNGANVETKLIVQ